MHAPTQGRLNIIGKEPNTRRKIKRSRISGDLVPGALMHYPQFTKRCLYNVSISRAKIKDSFDTRSRVSLIFLIDVSNA